MAEYTELTPELAISALVNASGNVLLTAERLTKLVGHSVTEEEIIKTLIGDAEYAGILISQLKAKFILDLFQSLAMTNLVYQDQLPVLEAKDVVKAMKALGDIFAIMTAKTESSAVDTFATLATKVVESLNLNRPNG